MEDGNSTAARIRHSVAYSADIFYLPTVASTSSALKSMRQMMRFSRPTLLFTDSQTEGRGTRGRSWLALPQRDLALSFALPDTTPGVLDQRLSLSVGAVTAAAVEQELALQQQAGEAALQQPALSVVHPGQDPQGAALCMRLKWPNDLCIIEDGMLRKVGGILLERSRGWTYIGIGININSRRSDYPPELHTKISTLSEASHRELHRWGIIAALAGALISRLGSGVDNDALTKEWQERDCTGHTRYLLSRNGSTTEVRALRVDLQSGALICADAAGQEYTVVSYSELSSPLEAPDAASCD